MKRKAKWLSSNLKTIKECLLIKSKVLNLVETIISNLNKMLLQYNKAMVSKWNANSNAKAKNNAKKVAENNQRDKMRKFSTDDDEDSFRNRTLKIHQ